ncbi:MAG: prepilin-type N-terminal cleavage/methylation domain-containing protein [Lachnospiraceae bacterium]|nr:prepilin-type N-terminal cleavage/methylation domain-containing protein [Lachnospiraceae bacterium]
MRNNKGYTLVELIVAVGVLLLVMAEVGALMINSQSLYKNGYYEVNLQENSQQVVQTIQDLLMNANVVDSLKVTTNTSLAGHKSDVIEFQTEERKRSGDTYTGTYETVDYKICRRADLPDFAGTERTGKAGEFSDLVLVRKVGAVETVSLIAEGVQSIYLTKNSDIESTADGDMFNVKTADVVSITMNMVNENYSYSTSGEIYLRNRIGTGGDPFPDSSKGSAADVDITILRIHDYKLTDFIPSEYATGGSFAFVTAGADNFYDLNTSTGEICCKLNLNSNWNVEKEADLTATSASGGTYKIHISTPKVNDGARMPVYTWTNTTVPMINAIPVNGICTCDKCAKNVVMDAQITLPCEGTVKVSKGGWPPSSTTETVDLAVLASNGLSGTNSKGFEIRLHTDEGPGDDDPKMGSGVSEWNCSANLENEIFNRVHEGGGKIEISRMFFSVCPMKQKDGIIMDHDIWEEYPDGFAYAGHQYRNDYYEYLLESAGNPADPYQKKGTAGQHCMYFPDPGSTGAGTIADFEVDRIHVDNKANGFSVNTTNHATASSAYWDYIVDLNPAVTGYIRLHVWCQFNKIDTLDKYTYIYDCYGYYFPQNTGTDDQHDRLVDELKATPTAEDIQPTPSSGNPKPYEYYEGGH